MPVQNAFAVAAQGVPDSETIKHADELASEGAEERGAKVSVAPIAGYNSIYGFFFGGAYFFTKTSASGLRSGFGGPILFTTEKYYKENLQASTELSRLVALEAVTEFGKGFDPYFGEGGDTRAEDRIDIKQYKGLGKAFVHFRVTDSLALSPHLDFRYRDEFGVDPGPERRIFPNERTYGFGLKQTLDLRDIPDSPNQGWFEQLTLIYLPKDLSTLAPSADTQQAILSIRRYQPLMTGGFSAAFNFEAGDSWGAPPSYLYRYRLGGTDRLRGFYDNRFRGERFYLFDNELRFPLYRMLSGVGFFGLGDTADAHFSGANLSYGGGLRVGLPPSYAQKIRIDVGFSRDQYGIFMDFGQAF